MRASSEPEVVTNPACSYAVGVIHQVVLTTYELFCYDMA